MSNDEINSRLVDEKESEEVPNDQDLEQDLEGKQDSKFESKDESNKSEKDENQESEEGETAKDSDEKDEQSSKEREQVSLDKFLRLQADFDNYRKRTAKEKEEVYKFALSEFAKKLLPVLDNMERAIKSIEEAEVDDPYVEGVKMVFSKLMETLSSEGLQEIEAERAQFNPEVHHGVAVENVEDAEDGQVVEVYQKGYKFKDRVLRPAMVKICKK